MLNRPAIKEFQSSFELTGYITKLELNIWINLIKFQSSFELTGYITMTLRDMLKDFNKVSKLFRAYGLYNKFRLHLKLSNLYFCFKALSSLRVI